MQPVWSVTSRNPRAAMSSKPASRTLEDRCMTRVYLVRHADVENPRHLLYGHLPGFPLSEHGRAQAAAVGRWLSDRGLKRIIHSPLERAAETARLMCEQLPEPVPLIPEP